MLFSLGIFVQHAQLWCTLTVLLSVGPWLSEQPSLTYWCILNVKTTFCLIWWEGGIQRHQKRGSIILIGMVWPVSGMVWLESCQFLEPYSSLQPVYADETELFLSLSACLIRTATNGYHRSAFSSSKERAKDWGLSHNFHVFAKSRTHYSHSFSCWLGQGHLKPFPGIRPFDIAAVAKRSPVLPGPVPCVERRDCWCPVHPRLCLVEQTSVLAPTWQPSASLISASVLQEWVIGEKKLQKMFC